ncbi:hypothetical protein [Cohnella sp. GCM10012308]|uniref:hypothetical protein n=1 Tax=Cohnella sp. GCM10012308 TaxID=3317329 RepID=UPI003607093B
MYCASPITDRLYGFHAPDGQLDPWVAIAQMKDEFMRDERGLMFADHEGNSARLELCARIFLPELQGPRQYETLLDAIRAFSREKMAEKGCESCLIYFTCKGIVDDGVNLPLPGMPSARGRLAVECEFVETIMTEPVGGYGKEERNYAG